MKPAPTLHLKLLGLAALLLGTVTHASTDLLNVMTPQVEGICAAGAGSVPVRALADASPLRVVAIGSSSTQGAGASRPALSYVAQLAGQLSAAWPTRAEVINKGIGGNTLADIVARAPQDLYAQQPNLVILQTGMNDVLRMVPPAAYRAQLLSFVQDIQAHHLKVILVDNQYAPAQVGTPEYVGIQQATHDVARSTGSELVSRYALSVALQAKAHLTASDLLSGDGLHPNDVMHACTATALDVTILKLKVQASRQSSLHPDQTQPTL